VDRVDDAPFRRERGRCGRRGATARPAIAGYRVAMSRAPVGFRGKQTSPSASAPTAHSPRAPTVRVLVLVHVVGHGACGLDRALRPERQAASVRSTRGSSCTSTASLCTCTNHDADRGLARRGHPLGTFIVRHVVDGDQFVSAGSAAHDAHLAAWHVERRGEQGEEGVVGGTVDRCRVHLNLQRPTVPADDSVVGGAWLQVDPQAGAAHGSARQRRVNAMSRRLSTRNACRK